MKYTHSESLPRVSVRTSRALEPIKGNFSATTVCTMKMRLVEALKAHLQFSVVYIVLTIVKGYHSHALYVTFAHMPMREVRFSGESLLIEQY